MSNRILSTAAYTLLAALLAAPAFAQTQLQRPERPYRGLFGSGLVADSGQSLVASASVGGGYDSNVLADLVGGGSSLGIGNVADPRLARSGAVGSVSGALEYSVRNDRVSFGAGIGEASRYYPQNSQAFIHSYTQTTGITYKAARRTTLSANQFVAYQPFLLGSLFPALFDPIPGQLNLPPVDLATGLASYLAYGGNAAVAQTLSRRVTFVADVNAQRSDTPYANTSLSQQGGNAGFRFELTRNLTLRTVYGRQEGRYAGPTNKVVTDTYDVGLEYTRPLSFSRRTTVSFSSGTSAMGGSQTQAQAGQTQRGRRYFVTGGAHLNHEIGRSWLASAAYGRSVQFMDTLLLPLLSDSFSGNVNGLFTRRLEFSSGVQGSIGTIGFTPGGEAFHAYQAFSSLAYALSRWANVSVSYSYYQYRFGTGTLLPEGISRDYNRQSARVNLNLWAPLVNKKRRN
jgi:hypothetical protein